MPLSRPRSEELFARACERMPGGVNSPVRAFRGVGGTPVFIRAASGATIEDEDGHRYIDYVASWGPMLLGHAHPVVLEAIREAASSGTSFGAPTARETIFAERIIEMVPSVEMVRLVNSGTEATLSAIRLARGFTGRPRLLKFEGCYHGHGDSLLVAAGSGVATLGIPGTPGVLPAVARETITIPFNDIEALESAFAAHGDALAAAIIEPVAGNMGCVPPREGYLERLRRLCTAHGAVLIFDEVMTGFRVAAGGVQERTGVTPDLTTLGKVVGGGLPLAAYGGRREIMEQVAPAGPVYQAGTLSGNPLAVAAGLATLDLLREDPDIYTRLEATGRRLFEGLREAAAEAGVAVHGHQVGAMFSLYFTDTPVWSFAEAQRTRTDLYGRFFHEMLDRGVYLAPSAYEALFPGAAHTDEDVDRTLAAAREAFRVLAEDAPR